MKFDEFPAQTLMEITARPPLVFVRGQGAWLWDHEGKRYLDFVQGWAVNCLGHSPSVVVDALAEQSRKLITPSPAFARGAYLMKGLSNLSACHGLGEVRGRGLLVALDLKRDIASQVTDIAREAGLLLNAPRPNLLRLMPALNLSRQEIDTMLKMLDGALCRALES